MQDYKIITDSTTDLSPDLIRNLDIEVVPLNFTIGGDTYFDYKDESQLSNHAFYSRLKKGEASTTNAIGIGTFTETMEPFLQAGKDILYISFSSGLSGTYNNSAIAVKELAQKYPERTLVTVDSLAASMGEGLLVYHAAQKKKAGASLLEVKDWLEQNRDKLNHWFTVDDLNHLRRGGRISGASALVGTMLGIKPVLYIDSQGHILMFEKVRGRRQSLDSLVDHMEKTAVEPEKQMVFISHGDCVESAEYVAEQLKKRLGVTTILFGTIGPVIGTHSGPGTVALFYLGKNKF